MGDSRFELLRQLEVGGCLSGSPTSRVRKFTTKLLDKMGSSRAATTASSGKESGYCYSLYSSQVGALWECLTKLSPTRECGGGLLTTRTLAGLRRELVPGCSALCRASPSEQAQNPNFGCVGNLNAGSFGTWVLLVPPGFGSNRAGLRGSSSGFFNTRTSMAMGPGSQRFFRLMSYKNRANSLPLWQGTAAKSVQAQALLQVLVPLSLAGL